MQQRNAPYLQVREHYRHDVGVGVGRLPDDGMLPGGRDITGKCCMSLTTIAGPAVRSPVGRSHRDDEQRRSTLRTCQSTGSAQRSSPPLPAWRNCSAKPACWTLASRERPRASARKSGAGLLLRPPMAIRQPAETVRPPPCFSS